MFKSITHKIFHNILLIIYLLKIYFVFVEHFTSDDELLMKAKINFTGTKVGEHPNVLKFIGAVTSDDASKGHIINVNIFSFNNMMII